MLLTLYFKRPRRKRRRPGSAADLEELTQRISREQLAAKRKRALARPVAAIRRFAKRHRIKVVDVDPARCRLTLSARPADAARAFAVALQKSEQDHWYPSRAPRLPKPLDKFTEAVLGLDQRPMASRLRNMAGPAGGNGLLPSEMARLYGMITAGQGGGQCVAVVTPKGGYDRADLAKACAAMGVPVPTLVEVSVGNGRNNFGVEHEADKEVSLDIQVVAGVAPRARIAVYFTESNERGYADGVSEAVHDAINRPSVIVFTWGESEDFWPDPARAAMDAALADAMQLGVTVVVAAGDDLATERRGDNRAYVDYPASSPYVLACGGTEITLSAAGDAIVDEVVWNRDNRGTGGGISASYPVPAYQRGLALPASVNAEAGPGRGVPDIAAAASEVNGYRITLHNAEIVTGGTSAAAPLWAGFIALLNEQRGHAIGFINPAFYDDPALLRQITSGNNRAFGVGYRAGPGWNACTGLGVPIGAAIVAQFSAKA